MLQLLFCCFQADRGIDGEDASPHGPSPPPTYTEACRGPGEEGVGGGRTFTSLRAKTNTDLEEPKFGYIKPSQTLQEHQAKFKDEGQAVTSSGQIEIPENRRKQVGFLKITLRKDYF